MTDMPPIVASVVVPTRNSIRTIRECLLSIRAQDVAGIELIVVDNFSDDGTWAVARELADIALQSGPERSAQRNAGIAHSRADWILWVDSDMVLPTDCVRVALATADGAGASAVALPEVTVGAGYLSACRALERSCYVDDETLHNPRLMRRDLLDELDGFDERMSGPEDTSLRHQLRAAGVEVVLAPIRVVHDEGRLTLLDVLQKRVYYGRSLRTFAQAHPGALREQGLGTLRAFWRQRRRLLADPPHAIGMLGMRAAEAAAYAVGAAQGRRARQE